MVVSDIVMRKATVSDPSPSSWQERAGVRPALSSCVGLTNVTDIFRRPSCRVRIESGVSLWVGIYFLKFSVEKQGIFVGCVFY